MQPYQDIIRPTLMVLPPKMNSENAAIMMLAIANQESGWRHRQQVGGPARSFFQFEKAGINGVLKHSASAKYAGALCQLRDVLPTVDLVYDAMLSDDIIGAGFARLLLWTDPKALPAVGDIDGAWSLYLRTWRPGKPHRNRWDECYHLAQAQMS